MHKFLMFGPLVFMAGTYLFTSLSDYYYNPVSLPNLLGLLISFGFIFAEATLSLIRYGKKNYIFDPDVFYQDYAGSIITDYDMANP